MSWRLTGISATLLILACPMLGLQAQGVGVGQTSKLVYDGKGVLEAVAISPNGKVIVWANCPVLHTKDLQAKAGKSQIVFYDIALQKITERVTVDGKISGLAFTSDGKTLVSVGGGHIRFWQTSTRTEKHAIKDEDHDPIFVAFSPPNPDRANKYLITGGADGKVKIWDATERKEKLVLEGISKRLTCIAVSRTRYEPFMVAAAGDSMIKVWDGESGKEKITFKGKSASRLSFLSGAKKLLSDLTIWDLDGEDEPITFSADRGLAALSPDGKFVAVCTGQPEVATIYNLETRKSVHKLQEKGGFATNVLSVKDCVFSPDGRNVICVGGVAYARIWQLPDLTKEKP